jgi:hypothetical protein
MEYNKTWKTLINEKILDTGSRFTFRYHNYIITKCVKIASNNVVRIFDDESEGQSCENIKELARIMFPRFRGNSNLFCRYLTLDDVSFDFLTWITSCDLDTKSFPCLMSVLRNATYPEEPKIFLEKEWKFILSQDILKNKYLITAQHKHYAGDRICSYDENTQTIRRLMSIVKCKSSLDVCRFLWGMYDADDICISIEGVPLAVIWAAMKCDTHRLEYMQLFHQRQQQCIWERSLEKQHQSKRFQQIYEKKERNERSCCIIV